MNERFYELAVIFQPELTSDEVEQKSENIIDLITKNQGELVKRELWGKRGLKYPIKKKTEGIYSIYYFTAPPDKISGFNSPLTLDSDVLRFLIVRSNFKLEDVQKAVEEEMEAYEEEEVKTEGKELLEEKQETEKEAEPEETEKEKEEKPEDELVGEEEEVEEPEEKEEEVVEGSEEKDEEENSEVTEPEEGEEKEEGE